ncbi:hypothetical protein [Methyloceanibacter marginalis]|uniref:hypothetical protein n=1 Tax=Methyloceanibacter marginalis TaxID=1774971 RepID=UPI001301044A|nr:hypothetical protein [Methyloceanibacter marginalis]
MMASAPGTSWLVRLTQEDIEKAIACGHYIAEYAAGDEVRRDERDRMRQCAEERERSAEHIRKEAKRLEDEDREGRRRERKELNFEKVEKLRAAAWSIRGTNYPGYEPRPDGVCRHKVAWLIDQLGGGKMVSGFRHDRSEPGFHAAFEFRSNGKTFVADQDGIWLAEDFPFAKVEGKHLRTRKPDSEPDIRKRETTDGSGHGSIHYQGTWDRERSYSAGQFVTHKGGLWHAEIDSQGCKPGDGALWKLAVKSGDYNNRNMKNHKQHEIDAAWNLHNERKDDAA